MAGSDPMEAASARHPDLKFTYDDYLLFPDDGKRHEVIDGEHYATPSSTIRHQEVSGRLHLLIATWLREHPVGRIFFAPLAVILSPFDIVEPDLLYVSNERATRLLGGTHVTGAPDLLIEIASPDTRKRDEILKRHLYERFSVQEYWVIDPEIEVVRVYRRAGDVFARAQELSREAGEVLATPLLPGLDIPLARVFAD